MQYRNLGLWFTAVMAGWLLGTATITAALRAPGTDAAAALFDTTRLLEVQIEMAQEDWDKLRNEHRDLVATLGPQRLEKLPPDPYQIYRATVTINGERLENVGVRKRGFIGSASTIRPSLGIRMDAFERGRRFHGLKRISLNNNLQDPSLIRQVLAYQIFAAAGVPAPRCSLARVTVNGQYLGVYSHVEAVDEVFLRRVFGEDSGNLYEGQISDFRPDWVKTFERKNNRTDASQEDLEAVVRALQAPDRQLSEAVGKVVDLEEYRSFWAVECLIGHWDSYSKGGNNFFVYRRTDSGKFVFIPWGADAVLGIPDPFTPGPVPVSVVAGTALPYRLYHVPAERVAYRQRLRELLQTVWKEEALLDEVERLRQLVRPHSHVAPSRFNASVIQIRAFIRSRRAAMEAELNGPAPPWPLPLRESPCLYPAGHFTADFQTTWRETLDLRATGPATLSFTAKGQKQTLMIGRAAAHRSLDARHPDGVALWFLGGTLTDARVRLGVIMVPSEHFAPGDVPVDGARALGFYVDARLLQQDQRFLGFLVGKMRLEAAATTPDAPIKGRLEAELYQFEKP